MTVRRADSSERRAVVRRRLIAFGAIAFVSSLWMGSNSAPARESRAFLDAVTRVDAARQHLVLDVLRVRAGQVGTYDPLVRGSTELRDALAALMVPGSLDAEDSERVAAAIHTMRSALESDLARVESFKSANARLRNSLRFAPTLAANIQAVLGADDERTSNVVTAGVQHALIVATMADPRIAALVVSDTQALDALHARLAASAPTSAVAVQLGQLARHLAAITAATAEVDGAVAALVAANAELPSAILRARFATGYARLERRQGSFRALLYATSLVLVAAMVFAAFRLRRAARAVARVNAHLEERVASRTAELAARAQRMRLVLDNVTQGILVVDEGGQLDAERSAAVDASLQPVAAARDLWTWVAGFDPVAADWLRVGWPDLFRGDLPFEVVADQLPRVVSTAERTFDVTYRLAHVAAGSPQESASQRPARVLVVFSDATDRLAREEAERDGADLVRLLGHLGQNRAALRAALQEIDGLVRVTCAESAARSVRVRSLHTLKGSSAILGLSGVARLCHRAEDAWSTGDDVAAESELVHARRAWQRMRAEIQPALGRTGLIELGPREYERLVTAVDTWPRGEIGKLVRGLRGESIEGRLRALADQLEAFARDVDKQVQVHVSGGDLRVAPERWGSVWSVLPHLLRNALSHGIEPPDARVQRGKSPTGNIWLRASRDERRGEIVLEIRDDGQGIRWDAVAARAERCGLSVNPADADSLTAALFHEGVSTADDVSELAGRGVGLSAVRAAVVAVGGHIDVTSAAGEGATFRCRLPRALAD